MSKPANTKSVKRSAARLAAVQALYEVDLSQSNVDDVVINFLKTRWNTPQEEGDELQTESPLAAPDKQLFTDVLRGVHKRQSELEDIVSGALSQEWTIERLEDIVRLILLAGVYELYIRLDIPPRVIITQYVDVAHAFFEGPEAKFINGVLDRVAKTLRSEELNA